MALSVALVSCVVGVSPAYADPSPALQDRPSSVAITATRSRDSEGSTGPSALTDSIVCELQINNAHKSTHVPGTINITATWSCTAPVSSLAIAITLYRNDIYVSEGSNSNSGSSSLQANAYNGCDTGSYQGVAIGNVTFPLAILQLLRRLPLQVPRCIFHVHEAEAKAHWVTSTW